MHKSWSGREGNKSIDLKVYFPCPHRSITTHAKAGNVLTVAGISGTESFSHCANKPEVSRPPKLDQRVAAIPSLVGETVLGEKPDHSASASSCLSCDPAVHPSTAAFGLSHCYFLWQGPSAAPWVCFFCSTLLCRGSGLTANAMHRARFIPCWKAARPEVEHGKHFTAPGNSTQLLKTSREESSAQTQGNFHIGRM